MKLPIFTLVLPVVTIKCCTAMTPVYFPANNESYLSRAEQITRMLPNAQMPGQPYVQPQPQNQYLQNIRYEQPPVPQYPNPQYGQTLPQNQYLQNIRYEQPPVPQNQYLQNIRYEQPPVPQYPNPQYGQPQPQNQYSQYGQPQPQNQYPQYGQPQPQYQYPQYGQTLPQYGQPQPQYQYPPDVPQMRRHRPLQLSQKDSTFNFDLAPVNPISDSTYDNSLPIPEVEGFYEDIPNIEETNSITNLTQTNVIGNVENLIKRSPAMISSNVGYKIPELEDIRKNRYIAQADGEKIIHPINVLKTNNDDGYTAMGVNKKALFFRIMNILRDPNNSLYPKIRNFMTEEIAHRCYQWSEINEDEELPQEEKALIIWFAESLKAKYRPDSSSTIARTYAELLRSDIDNNHLYNAASNIKNRIRRHLDEKRINSIYYYECVKYFVKYLLTRSSRKDKRYALSSHHGMGDIIAYIINQRIPVIEQKSGRGKIINIFGYGIKINLTPRIWLIVNSNGRFKRGQITLQQNILLEPTRSIFRSTITNSDTRSDTEHEVNARSINQPIQFDLAPTISLTASYEASLPITEDIEFYNVHYTHNEPSDVTDMLTQENILRAPIEDLIRNHPEMRYSNGYAIPNRGYVAVSGSNDISYNDPLSIKQEAPHIIHMIKVNGIGNCGYTSLGVNKRMLFHKITNILRNPEDRLYRKIKEYVTEEIFARCSAWLEEDDLFKKLLHLDKKFILWFAAPLDEINNQDREGIQTHFNNSPINDDTRLDAIKCDHSDIFKNLNAINNPEIYYEYVKHFIKHILVGETSSDSKYELLSSHGMGDIIAYIMNQRIPVLQQQNPRDQTAKVISIFGDDINKNLMPRVFIKLENGHFTRGQILPEEIQ